MIAYLSNSIAILCFISIPIYNYNNILLNIKVYILIATYHVWQSIYQRACRRQPKLFYHETPSITKSISVFEKKIVSWFLVVQNNILKNNIYILIFFILIFFYCFTFLNNNTVCYIICHTFTFLSILIHNKVKFTISSLWVIAR